MFSPPIPCLDLSLDDPAANLALDDALLEEAEANGGGEILRFWESPAHFVVLGAGSPSAADVDLDACRAAGVPVLRRCSGGGTVVQGPGCLNYALVLDREARPGLATIDSTNRTILASVARALSAFGISAEQAGISDLGAAGRKFSGNAQRRKKRHILFHGTILYRFDLTRISAFLQEPERQPEWRARRSHNDFVCNLPVDPYHFRQALQAQWNAATPAAVWPRDRVQALIQSKYARDDWNFGL